MQFLKFNPISTLLDLTSRVGSRNIDSILSANSIPRSPRIGMEFTDICNTIIANSPIVSIQRKASILNTVTSDADIFESVALLSESGWKLMSNLGTIPNYLKIPESITLPDAPDIIGNRKPVKRVVYDKALSELHKYGTVNPSVFNEYSTQNSSGINAVSTQNSPLQWFKIPWGEISLYSSITDTSIDFPVYPSGIRDGVSANYETMPDIIYQYEPWQVYKDSGPRTVTYEFNMHRDMWSGDHRDGRCNELIRFCKANCYPRYMGAAVQAPIVTLYISGKPHISGVMTSVEDSWDGDGPIGLDGFYLHVDLSITITEVSNTRIDFDTMKNKGLIG